MANAISCYVVRDDLLILVPDTDEMADRIYRQIGPPPEGVRWIVLAPGSTVSDIREAASTPHDPRCDVIRNGDQFVCRTHLRHWDTGICPGLRV